MRWLRRLEYRTRIHNPGRRNLGRRNPGRRNSQPGPSDTHDDDLIEDGPYVDRHLNVEEIIAM